MAAILSTLSAVGAGTPANGGDTYTTMSAWENAQQGVKGAGDTSTLECYDDFTDGLDEENITVQGWTASAGNEITIKAAPGDENNGVFGSGFRIKRSATTFAKILQISQSFVNVQDIEIWDTGTTCQNAPFSATVSDVVIERCIFRTSSTHASSSGVDLRGIGTTQLINCFARGYVGVKVPSAWLPTIINCTVVGVSTYGIISHTSGSSFASVRGTYAEGPTASFFNSFASGSDYNGGDDTTAPGANSVDNVTSAAFVNSAGDDWNLESGGALSGVGASPPDLATDIAGNTRNDPDDIGAYAIQGAAPYSFVGPNIDNQTGTDGVEFVFNKAPDASDVSTRFSDPGTYTKGAGTWPAGLDVDPTTGNITGTPTETGTFPNLTITGTKT